MQEGGGVQCTCKGFETDLVRLWQRFRVHNLDYVRTELPKIMCSFCCHELSEHLTSGSSSSSTNQTEHAQHVTRNNCRLLTLKSSASIARSVALGKSTALLLPTSIDRCKEMATILLQRVGDTKELELCLVSYDFRTLEAVAKTDTKMSSIPVSNQCSGDVTERQVTPDEIVNQDDPSAEGKKPHTTKKGTKRKSSEKVSPVLPKSTRRSSRIAEMKKKKIAEKMTKLSSVDEEWLKQIKSKKSKLEALLERKGFGSETDMECGNATPLRSDSEIEYLSSNAMEFVQSLSKDTSFKRCGKLPDVRMHSIMKALKC